jgi:hypothetical protein
LRKGEFLVHRGLQRSEDETEIRVDERTGGTGREEYPSGDTAAFFSRREDPCNQRLVGDFLVPWRLIANAV